MLLLFNFNRCLTMAIRYAKQKFRRSKLKNLSPKGPMTVQSVIQNELF